MYLNNPEYVRVGEREYKINTDFRVAIRCNEVATDPTIGDYERAMAIIYLLYGDKGLEATEDYEKLMELGCKFLQCGETADNTTNEQPDMDFKQDFKLIQASFYSDYGIDIQNQNIHWWDFFTYLNGLTDKCVLNRVRELRNFDLNEIKDANDRRKIQKQKERWKLKEEPKELTQEQRKSVDNFYKLTGLQRKE